MKRLKLKSNHRPALFRFNGMTRVVAGTIAEVDGKPWKHAYVAIKGHFTLDMIDWSPIEYSKSVPVKPKTKKVIGSKGNVYTVEIYASGKKTCTCPGYQYRRFCKHTGAK